MSSQKSMRWYGKPLTGAITDIFYQHDFPGKHFLLCQTNLPFKFRCLTKCIHALLRHRHQLEKLRVMEYLRYLFLPKKHKPNCALCQRLIGYTSESFSNEKWSWILSLKFWETLKLKRNFTSIFLRNFRRFTRHMTVSVSVKDISTG